MKAPNTVLSNATPSDVLCQLYAPIVQATLDGGVVYSTPPEHVSALALTSGRDPATEAVIRTILLTTLETWAFFSRNPAVQSRLQAAIVAISDPTTWNNIATIIFGPATPLPTAG